MFPIFALEGGSHMSYMTGDAPKAVKARDLIADIDDALAKKQFAGAVVSFMDQILKNDFSTPFNSDTEAVLHGLVDAMEMEGSAHLKPPCFGHEFDNPHVPTCWHGSAWS